MLYVDPYIVMTLEELVVNGAIDGVGESALPILQGIPGTNGVDGDTIYTEYQYSVTGDADWHDVFVTGDYYIRSRTVTNGDSPAWSEAARFTGEQGEAGDTIYRTYQYSVDGVNWHTTFTTGDYYMQYADVVNEEVGDYSDAIKIVPIKGTDYVDGSTIYTQFEYSIDGLTDWHVDLTTEDKYLRTYIVADGDSSTPSDAVKFIPEAGVDYATNGIDAVTYAAQAQTSAEQAQIFAEAAETIVGTFNMNGTYKSERAYNGGDSVIVFTDLGDNALVPLSDSNEDNDLFTFDTATNLLQVKGDGLHLLHLIEHIADGAGTAEVWNSLVQFDDTSYSNPVVLGGSIPVVHDSNEAGNILSTTVPLDSTKYYAIHKQNTTSGNVTYTSDTTTLSGSDITGLTLSATATAYAFILSVSKPY